MNRAELEHVIRAAGEIVDDDVVVLGSQALLAAFPDAPADLLRSMEADVYPLHDPERADEIDGAIGDGSRFHDVYGYYAHGVGPETAVAPAGWQTRLIRVDAAPAVGGRSHRAGWCLEPHDLMLAKLAAGRERDWEFVELALRHQLVDAATLRDRVGGMPGSHRERVQHALGGVLARAAR